MHQSGANFFLINTEKNVKISHTSSPANLYLRNHLEQGKDPAQLQFLHATKGKGQTKTIQCETNRALFLSLQTYNGANAGCSMHFLCFFLCFFFLEFGKINERV